MIIFEEIFPVHYWIIRYYLAIGIKVYFLRAHRLCFRNQWFNSFVEQKKIEHLPRSFIANFLDGFYEDLACDNADKFFKAVKSNRNVNKIKKLYGVDDIELVFRRVCVRHLSRFYYLNYTLNYFQKKYFCKKISFVPSNGIAPVNYRTDGCEIVDYFKYRGIARKVNAYLFNDRGINFPLWAIIYSYIRACKRLFKTFLVNFGFLPFLFIKKIKSMASVHDVFNGHYKYAVMITAPHRQFTNKVQKVDFLVDESLIKKRDVLFMSSMKIPASCRKYLLDNQLNYLDNLEQFISWEDILKILPVYLSIAVFPVGDSLVLEAAIQLVYYYLRWEGVAKNVKIDKIISYCDFGIHPIARNIILGKYGTESFYYQDSINSTYFFPKMNSGYRYTHTLLGFLKYDYFICWNESIAEYFRRCKSIFKHYVNLGCFWSEHLKLIRQGYIKLDFKDKLRQHGYKEGMKLISVFDSTYLEESLTIYDDGIEFLKGILRLLDDFPGVFVVIKEKQKRDFHKKVTGKSLDILNLYIELENHPRCYSITTWENSSEIIAFSDLTISFPFSSTTFETFSARGRAIWYDATNKFRDTFYDKIPGLVCHGYEELSERVRALLFEISEAEFNDYLDKYIKGSVESYLDGMAITRFRELLAGGNNYRHNSDLERKIKVARS